MNPATLQSMLSGPLSRGLALYIENNVEMACAELACVFVSLRLQSCMRTSVPDDTIIRNKKNKCVVFFNPRCVPRCTART